MRFLLSSFLVLAAGLWSAVLPINAQVNVTQEQNNLSRNGLYTDSAFTPSAAASVTRDLNFNGAISGNVYAQPLYIENGPGGVSMVIVVTESNNVYAFKRRYWHGHLAAEPWHACQFRAAVRQYQSARHHWHARCRSCLQIPVRRCDGRWRDQEAFHLFAQCGYRWD